MQKVTQYLPRKIDGHGLLPPKLTVKDKIGDLSDYIKASKKDVNACLHGKHFECGRMKCGIQIELL